MRGDSAVGVAPGASTLGRAPNALRPPDTPPSAQRPVRRVRVEEEAAAVHSKRRRQSSPLSPPAGVGPPTFVRQEPPSATVSRPPPSSSSSDGDDLSPFELDTEGERLLREEIADPSVVLVGGQDRYSDS